jgi:hypothetical protein
VKRVAHGLGDQWGKRWQRVGNEWLLVVSELVGDSRESLANPPPQRLKPRANDYFFAAMNRYATQNESNIQLLLAAGRDKACLYWNLLMTSD